MSGRTNRWHSRGQSLLEVTVSIGIAVVVIAALSIVTISGLKNSEYSQNQSVATKLAQDWLEQTRAIRDRNGTVCNPLAAPQYSLWSSLWVTSCGGTGSQCTFVVVPSGTCSVNPSATTTPLLEYYDPAHPDSNFTQYSLTGSKNQFSRLITIEDYNNDPKQKKVTSTVTWTDISGVHQSNLVTILTNQ